MKRDQKLSSRSVSLWSSSKENFPERHVMPMVNMDEAAAFQRVRDDLPEEERKGNKGKILKYVLELCQSGWSFCQALKNVGEICTLGEHIVTIEALLGKITEDGKEAVRFLELSTIKRKTLQVPYCSITGTNLAAPCQNCMRTLRRTRSPTIKRRETRF